MNVEEIIADLNSDQKRAVEHFQGPALVLAGAGSGKTRVLTRRIAYLIAHHDVKPESILAVTFTNKAADEMKERVAELLGSRPASWVGTFHSFAARLLRREAEKLGYGSNFVIYDTSDQRQLIKEILQDMNLDDENTSPRQLASRISNAKSDLIRPRDFTAAEGSYIEQIMKEIYPEYQKRLKASNALDFDDLLLKTCQLFSEYEAVKNYYQQKYRYLLIDEYQDVNNAQYRLSQHLAREHGNIFVVGDPDQSIYGFRGADIRNILNFERDYPQAEVIRLEQNYRSRQKILTAAQSVIANNESRREKDLWSERGPGSDIIRASLDSGSQEAEYVSRRVKKLTEEENYNYGDIGILYRTNSQSRRLEDVFMKMKLPYEIVGGLRFYERREIKDIMAYLRLVYNPDDEASFLRVINTPRRGIGSRTLERVKNHASARGISLYQAISRPSDIPGLTAAYQERVKEFAVLVERLQEINRQGTLVDLVRAVLQETEYEQHIMDREGDNARERLENIGEMQNLIREYMQEADEPGLGDFLEEVKLVADVDRWDESSDHLTMMTLHSAKGLEFPVIFMVGMDEGLFPHENCRDSQEEIEEERRLCYVGMTRAEEKLFMVRARQRRRFGSSRQYRPSRFLQEIDESVITCENLKRGRITSERRSEAVTADISEADGPGIFSGSADRSNGNYSRGDRVKHPEFGRGEIISVEDESDDELLTVRFEDGQKKQLMASFAPLQRQN